MPILLGGWFLGVMILGLRLLGGVGTVAWWRWSSLSVTDPYWVELVHRLSRELGLVRPPRLAVSLRAEDAFSLGLFRPVIVLPAAWLLKLPPDALENVLAHELSHIRRFDAWANLFQRVLEAWLFYHPAVWWLSRQMDEEREKCTDLWAVSLTGDRLRYVKTLAGIAEFQREARRAKSNGPILATGMGGRNMVLLERVRHILGQTPRTGAASRFLAGTMVLAIPMALWVGTMMLPASADEGDTLIAQADDDEKRGDREEGDRDRRDGERRDGDRPREDGERRDGDRPRGERERDGDRPRGEGERRDGDRPRGEGPRDGDRPRPEGERRDGDRPRPEGERRDGDRPRPDEPARDGDRPRGEEGRPAVFPPRGLPGGGGPPRFREIELPRGEGQPGPQGELLELIRELRREVAQLRQEVRELREGREGGGPRPEFRRPGGDFRPDGQQGIRPPGRRPDGERREDDRPDGEGEGDPRARVIERRVEIRREADRIQREAESRLEALEAESEQAEYARQADRIQREAESRLEALEAERNASEELLDLARERLDEAREPEAKDRPEEKSEGDRPERESDHDE